MHYGRKLILSPTTHAPHSKPETGNEARRKWLIENVTSLGLALLLVFMIRSSVVEAFKIPSGSMIPTLLIGDHIFVNKFAYGFKIPFSDLVTDHPDLRRSSAIRPSAATSSSSCIPRTRASITSSASSAFRATRSRSATRVLYINEQADPARPARAAESRKDLQVARRPQVQPEQPRPLHMSTSGTTTHLMHARQEQLHGRKLRPDHGAAGQPFRDGRQPRLLERQPLLGLRADAGTSRARPS